MKRKYWLRGLELDGLEENKIPFTVLKKQGSDLYYVEVGSDGL